MLLDPLEADAVGTAGTEPARYANGDDVGGRPPAAWRRGLRRVPGHAPPIAIKRSEDQSRSKHTPLRMELRAQLHGTSAGVIRAAARWRGHAGDQLNPVALLSQWGNGAARKLTRRRGLRVTLSSFDGHETSHPPHSTSTVAPSFTSPRRIPAQRRSNAAPRAFQRPCAIDGIVSRQPSRRARHRSAPASPCGRRAASGPAHCLDIGPHMRLPQPMERVSIEPVENSGRKCARTLHHLSSFSTSSPSPRLARCWLLFG